MTIVENTLTNAIDQPIANQGVSVRLVCSGFVDTGKLQILSTSYSSTDESGAYSFDLTPQSQIDPEGTYYEVTHPNGEILAFIVSDATGPLWLRDLLVSSPAHPGGVVAGVTSAQLSSAVAVAEAAAIAASEPVGLSDATKTVLSGTYVPVTAHAFTSTEKVQSLANVGGAKAVPPSLTVYEQQSDHVKKVMYQEGDDLYAVAQSGTFTVYKSTDFGQTWTTQGTLDWLPRALMRVETTGTLIAVESTNQAIAGTTPAVSRSTDDGVTWTSVTTLNFPPLNTSGMTETASGYILIGEYGNVADTSYKIWQSTDDGLTFSVVASSPGTDPGGDPGHWHSITWDPYQEVFVAFQDRPSPDIYQSADEGSTWTLIGHVTDPSWPNFLSPMHFPNYIAWGPDDQNGGEISRILRSDFYAGNFDQRELVHTVNRKAAYYTFPLLDDTSPIGAVWALSTATEVITPETLAPGSYGQQVYLISDEGLTVSGGVESVTEQTLVGTLPGLKINYPGYHYASMDHSGKTWLMVPSITSPYGLTSMPATCGTDPVMRRTSRAPVTAGVRKMAPGCYYGVSAGYTPSSAASAVGTLFATPLWVPSTCRIDRIAIEATGATPGGLMRLGIFDSNVYDTPNILLLDAGTVDCSTLGVKEAVVNLTLTPGLYWLAAVGQGTATPVVRNIGNTSQPPVASNSFVGSSGSTGMNAYYRTGQTGALSNWQGLSSTPGAPKIMVRVA